MTRKEALKIRGHIENAVQSLSESAALEVPTLYPKWTVGKDYTAGIRVYYGGKLYAVQQAHTSQADWTPDVAASLFVVVNETNAGSKVDPIPYDGNMELFNGKYYTQNGVMYLCNRDTGNPVYHALKDLVGLYVEVVS